MRKIYGKDGSVYHDANEAVRANARWDQQEKQNKLIKEQNELLRKQMNKNNSNSGISMSSRESAIIDKFVDFIIPAFFIIIGFIIAKFGIIDALISGIFMMFKIDIGWNSEQNQIGMILLAVSIIIYVFKKVLRK